MDRGALRQKIAIFTRGLENEEDAAVRRTVRRLLAQAEADLARLEPEADTVTEAVGRRLADIGIPNNGSRHK